MLASAAFLVAEMLRQNKKVRKSEKNRTGKTSYGLEATGYINPICQLEDKIHNGSHIVNFMEKESYTKFCGILISFHEVMK